MCIYSYMFKLQSPSKYTSFDAIHCFHCSKWLLNLPILMPSGATAVFFVCFPSSTWGNIFLFEEFFHQGKQKQSLGQDRVNREGGAWLSCSFWSKLLNTQLRMDRCAHKSPIMKWAKKGSSKKYTEAECSFSE